MVMRTYLDDKEEFLFSGETEVSETISGLPVKGEQLQD